MRVLLSAPVAARLLPVLACVGAIALPAVSLALTPDEEAQSFLRQAVLALEQDNVDPALKLLDKAGDSGAAVQDAPWRDAILEGVHQATLAVLMAAASAKWEQGAYDQSFKYYMRAVDRGGLGPLTDEVRRTAARAVHLHMLQVWLSGDEKSARAVAQVAKQAADAAFGRSSERTALDDLSTRIARPRSTEVLVRSEIERTKRSLESDGPPFPDPRQPWRLGLLAQTLRGFDLAATLFERSLAATEGSDTSVSRAIRIGAEEKLQHVRSLVRKLVVRSNVPFYSVEVWRPDAQLPEGSAEAEDATAGVEFQVHPGRYIIKVFNAEYGTCDRDDVVVETTDTVARCRFTAPPVEVTLDARPKGLEARVTPSDQIDWRALPFAMNLMRGRYTLSVRHPAFKEPVEVPVVVTREGQQSFDLDLTVGTIEMAIPQENSTARVRVDGRDIPRALGRTIEVEPGAHTVEVFQVGYETWRSPVVVRPLDRTIVKPVLVAGVGDDEVPPPPGRMLHAAAGYGIALRDAELTGFDRNGDVGTISRSYAIHRVLADVRWVPTEGADPYAPRWIVRAAADVGIASGSPVDDMLLATVSAGGGVQLLSRGGEWVTLLAAYTLSVGEWSQTWSEGAFTMNQLLPAGLTIGADSRVGIVAAQLDGRFGWGTGQKRQSTVVPGLPSGDVDLDFMGASAELFVGVDMVDLIVQDDDLDVLLGPTGFFTWYREKRSDKPSPFQVVDGGAGVRVGASWRLRGAVDTRVFAIADMRFLGDLATELAPVFDEKSSLGAVVGAGNVFVRAGVEVGF